tara:strand:- start:761 stop:979 length:219 start_codon:yes stop_codon:yes gene_type:complete
MEIIADTWFTGKENVGAVAIKSHNGWKAYIGVGRGYNLLADKRSIANHGCKLRKRVAIAIFSHLNPDEYEEE